MNVKESYDLSRIPAVRQTVTLPGIDFSELVVNRHKLAKNELLVSRRPDIQAAYQKFRDSLTTRNSSLHEVISKRLQALGSGVLAAIFPDDYPANILSGCPKAVHYNLWVATVDGIPDFRAADSALRQLAGRNPALEAHCFKRPPTQSIAPGQELPYDHCHVFTQATLPAGGIVVVA